MDTIKKVKMQTQIERKPFAIYVFNKGTIRRIQYFIKDGMGIARKLHKKMFNIIRHHGNAN